MDEEDYGEEENESMVEDYEEDGNNESTYHPRDNNKYFNY